jgi:hypothetical protein
MLASVVLPKITAKGEQNSLLLPGFHLLLPLSREGCVIMYLGKTFVSNTVYGVKMSLGTNLKELRQICSMIHR